MRVFVDWIVPRLVEGLKYSLIALLAAVVVEGCGAGHRTDISYYYPDWTPDGKIICIKNITVVEEKGPYGGGGVVSDDYYITTMTEEGTMETDIKKINGIGKVVASPLGNYIAYVEGNYIKLSSNSGTDIRSIYCEEKINSLDWAPDEMKIVYAGENSQDMYIVNINSGERTKLATNAAEVAWRVGDKIAYGFLYIVDSDGSNNKYLIDGGKPQIMNSGRILYYADMVSLGKYIIKSIYHTATSEAIVMEEYDKSSLRLSFDNNKVIGGILDGEHIKGIWVSNIDGSGSKQLR